MEKVFEGLYTALVTPFTNENKIDFQALENLLDGQLSVHVDGLVVMGTTGESPVIYDKEMAELVSFIRQRTEGQCQLIVGTGSNDTAFAIEETKLCSGLGVDALMLVNPYYNKPTQEGLFQHFRKLSKATDLPILLYNIPGRTGVNLETETLLRLTEACPNIRGVKEASGSLDQITDVLRQKPEYFSVLSGDDALTFPLMALGGDGVVSVLGNLRPQVMRNLVDALKSGDLPSARKLHFQWVELMGALLKVGNNPLAVKTLLFLENRIGQHVRLPLYPLSQTEQKTLQSVLGICSQR